ncbi:MAG: hypothetical protein ABI759_17715 [Candidatus Solibacter sp.]
MNRRAFLRNTGFAGGAIAGESVLLGQSRANGAVSLVLDPSDAVASAAPVQWAAGELQQALTAAGFTVKRVERIEQARAGGVCIVAAGSKAPAAIAALKRGNATAPEAPESLALLSTSIGGRQATLACGADARGLSYALLELADRVRHSAQPEAALKFAAAVAERPANPVRSIMRQFNSEPLDKPWFYYREMWPQYLGMLAAQRFNRFHLAFGLGYDDLRNVTDSYLVFLYPFLLAVPGYNVRATNLPDAERDRNLETLRFISEQTVARGIEFQLGVWMHGYQWPTSLRAQNTIEGITAENHANYCRDALTAVLRACPAISSVALRIHGESGIAEGSYDFWKTVFSGVPRCGRTVEIDLHAKGIDQTMIDGALATGMPVNIAPKYWAEHLGMPYHQAAIRELELPVAGHTGAGLMALSEGSRIATRYGYADLMRDDRKYTVRHRIFSGTQRILMWGDPGSAAAYSRMFQFCGSTGADLMEPLTCRGRRGTGAGKRSGYAEASLEPKWDWEKYTYWYRVWGRMLYNPDTGVEVSNREFGAAAKPAWASALARASRILPIVTTAYLPSAACDAYWPEIYWNQPMASVPSYNPYGDTKAPKTFPNASPLDPQLFSQMNEFADELLKGDRSGKYSPIEVAQWIEDLADGAAKDLRQAGTPASVDQRRLAIDVAMQADLGRFFGARFRSGVLYAIHERTSDRRALEESIKAYSAARAAWAQLTDRAKGVYQADLSASDKNSERGQWSDRLPAIDQDIASLEQHLAAAKASADPRVTAAIEQALGRPRRDAASCTHRPPAGFRPLEAVSLEIAVDKSRQPLAVRLHYRHVNQAERYVDVAMEARDHVYRASIPAAYTDSPYPLQYYFEVKESADKAWIYPGFAANLAGLPYIVLRRR